MSRTTRAVIDLAALAHNYRVLQSLAPNSDVMAVIKADAYGHGLESAARALAHADVLGVAYLGEAQRVRHAGVHAPVVILEGVMNPDEYESAARDGFGVVIHQECQVQWLESRSLPAPVEVWLKIDTGMNRLGIPLSQAAAIHARLAALSTVSEVVLMSHLACADEPDHPLSALQRERFESVTSQMSGKRSLANSAGILLGNAWHYSVVRPGIALYGASPGGGCAPCALGLRPVMRLLAPVIAINGVERGESVGYGATWTASRETRVAIIAIGYGDGYPRHVDTRAHVVINGVACPVVGRVSMDMLAVDVTDGKVTLGDEAELWGPALPVDTVAEWAGTLNYELLCQVTARVRRVYEVNTP